LAEDAEASDGVLDDVDPDLRVFEESAGELFADLRGAFGHGFALEVDFTDQRHGDGTVSGEAVLRVEFRFLKHFHEHHVAAAESVIAVEVGGGFGVGRLGSRVQACPKE
jgi:hypothetical protein